MSKFTVEETNLICIYNTGSRIGLLAELSEMKNHLEQDEGELLGITNSVMNKITGMGDGEFDRIVAELVIDFEMR